jgi:hypothetical protein
MAAVPPPSRLQQLEDSVAQLARVFLPTHVKPPPELYSDDELISSKAYIVFAHAEIEDFLEACCRAKATRALNLLAQNGVASVTALALISHFGAPLPSSSEIAKYRTRDGDLAPHFPVFHAASTRAILSRLKDAMGSYITQCGRNNGIKESNLLQMLAPLG